MTEKSLSALPRRLIGAVIKRRRAYEYHARHAEQATLILKQLNSIGKQLRPADVKLCEEYATEVFRGKRFTPWLLVYCAVSGAFKEGWIPDNYYGEKVIPVIKGQHGKVSTLKSMSQILFCSPSFPDLGSQVNGLLFDNQYRCISFENARSLFFQSNRNVIFKSDGTARGEGIHLLDRDSFDTSTVELLGNGVFQRQVLQHPVFDAFAQASVATIRLTTVADDKGEISLRAAYLRLGTGSDTHVRSQSHVRVCLDMATGSLNEQGVLANWRECSLHPTTGEPFGGKRIPAFAEAISTVVALHQHIPFVRCVGWDVAVDAEEKVQVLEWNGDHNDIKFSEAVQGPCFTGLGWERFA